MDKCRRYHTLVRRLRACLPPILAPLADQSESSTVLGNAPPTPLGQRGQRAGILLSRLGASAAGNWLAGISLQETSLSACLPVCLSCLPVCLPTKQPAGLPAVHADGRGLTHLQYLARTHARTHTHTHKHTHTHTHRRHVFDCRALAGSSVRCRFVCKRPS